MYGAEKGVDNAIAFLQDYMELPTNSLPTEYWDWQVTEPEWFMEKQIPAKSIGMVFGNSNSGKSHLICDIIISVLNGCGHWQGTPIASGDVIMFSESIGHIKARLKAYRSSHKMPVAHNMMLLPTKGFIASQIEDLGEWIGGLEKKPVLIVFDTLATAFQFDENDNREASRLIKLIEDHVLPNLDERGTACFVHHTSKASEGRSARGATALIGNIDWSIKVHWDNDLERTIASWDKDRWRLVDHDPQWCGHKISVPVNFTNGQMDMKILEWEEYDEEVAETAKKLQEESKLHQAKAEVARAIREHTGSVYLHTNTRAKVPAGYVQFSLGELVSNTRIYDLIYRYIRDSFTTEVVFNSNGVETGFLVKK